MLKHRIQDFGSIKLIKSEKKRWSFLNRHAWEQNVFAAFRPQRFWLWKEADYEHLKVIQVFSAVWWVPPGNKLITGGKLHQSQKKKKKDNLFSSIIWNNLENFCHHHFFLQSILSDYNIFNITEIGSF